MENKSLPAYLFNEVGSSSVDVKLKNMLSILRKHLDMDVAFISEFVDGERVFKFVDAEDENAPVSVGGSDPLEKTYCKRIVDDELDNIINDTQINPVTRNMSVTDKLSIGAYMGVPIMLSSGEVYGTFCCYKDVPDETLNSRDLSFLNAISEIASELIEGDIKAETLYRGVSSRVQSVLDEEGIAIHYQPIYSLKSGRVVGFESLSRFITEPYRAPNIWFDEAASVNMGEALEVMAIGKAIEGMHAFSADRYIAVNASPDSILSGAVHAALKNTDASRIVLEVTEHSPIYSYADLREALEPLRERGVRLAIDDAGSGYASFHHILELGADIIKLDITLTQDIHCHPQKFLLAKALCAFAKAVGCNVIAEGIEKIEELNVLRELGVDKAQGYFLGRPAPISDALFHEGRTLTE